MYAAFMLSCKTVEKCLLLRQKENRETGLNPVRLGRCNERRTLEEIVTG